MEQPQVIPPVEAGAAAPKPGDGAGPSRLRDSLQAGKQRGAYKCKKCGERHGEGNPCGSGAAPAPRAARSSGAAPAPAPVQVFTPENTGRLLRAPFTVAAVKTNCRIWLLTPAEEAELVATAVPCANEWIAVEPKWAALFMFAFSLSGVAISKAMDYAGWRQAMIAEAAEAARRAKLANPEQPAPKNDDGAAQSPIPPATPPPAAPAVS